MKIEKLYVYPIKSFRGVSVDSSTLTNQGFPYDRQFTLLQVIEEGMEKTFKNMSVAHYNEMVRFFPEIDSSKGTLTVTFNPINNGESRSIEIPLEPDTSDLEVIDVLMHKAPTKAYNMGSKYNEWLSSCFEYECVLAYIGENAREVRMSALGYNPSSSQTSGATGWLSSISSVASKATGMLTGEAKPSSIKFSDVAPYLFVSSRSMDDVHRRLPGGEKFDITKFRPNVVVSGADEPWEEDFWSELTIAGKTQIECEHNCNRCRSINVDYEYVYWDRDPAEGKIRLKQLLTLSFYPLSTGAQGTGESGKMLKLLSSDRRVDKGAKWSPVFGRYGFLPPGSEGDEIRVGDEVVVSRVNEEHTAFDWKGLSTLPGDVKE